LAALHQQWFRPDQAQILVVGDISQNELKPLLEQTFADWRAPAVPAPTATLPVVAVPAPKVVLIDKPGSEQSLIVAASLAPPFNDPDHEKLQMANQVLGGLFSSRLNLNLREDKHWSYGARSGFDDNRGQALFSASAQIERAHTAEALLEAQKELRELLTTRPPTAEELSAARQGLISELPAQAETSSGTAGLLGQILTFGLPLDYYQGYPARLAALSPQAVQQAAKKLYQPDQLTWFVVGDLAVIEASIRKLNLAPVQVMDADGKVLR
jgi:zinc protease